MPSVSVRGEKFVTKANLLKKIRVKNLQGKVIVDSENTVSFGNIILPDHLVVDIVLLLDINSIIQLSKCNKALDNSLTRGVWKKLVECDFPNSNLKFEHSSKETYPLLFKETLANKNITQNLQNTISDLKNKLDKFQTTLETKETELDAYWMLQVQPIAEKAVTIICRKKVAKSKDGYVNANKSHGKPTLLINVSKAVTGSSSASSSSLRKRSQIVEKVLSDISSLSENVAGPSNKISQNASLISRNKDVYGVCKRGWDKTCHQI